MFRTRERYKTIEEIREAEKLEKEFYWTGIWTLISSAEQYVDSKSFIVGASYFAVSFVLPFLNKTLLSTFNFGYLFFLLSVQMIVTITSMEIGKWFGFAALEMDIDWHHCVACWKISLCYAANACISLYSIAGLNIAVIDMIKRLGPFVNLILSVTVLKRPFMLNYAGIGIFMSAFGCLIGALGDYTSNFYLYGLTVCSVILQSFYQTEVEKVSHEEDITPFEILYINAVNTLPILIIIFAASGEYMDALVTDLWLESTFIVLFTIVILSGVVLNGLLFLSAKCNSAITTSMIGVTKSTLTSFIGLFCFDGMRVTHTFLFGLAMNMVGALTYMHARYLQAKETYEESALEDERESSEDSS